VKQDTASTKQPNRSSSTSGKPLRLTPSEIASLRTDFQVAGRKMAAYLSGKAAKTK
jgi:hypothetical protein